MERVQKVIAQFSKVSRRKAEQLIKDKQVKINNKIAILGDKVLPTDVILVNNKKLVQKKHKVYYLLNKPRGCVSTTSDEKNRLTVVDLVPDKFRVFPVGRLDYNTTGAILITNDGEFSQTLAHPKYKVKKKYIAIIKGLISYSEIKLLSEGVKLRTGYITKPCKVKILSQNKDTKKTKVSIILHEGKKHQIKLMFETLGYLVAKLHRESFGPFSVKNLASKQFINIDPSKLTFIKNNKN